MQQTNNHHYRVYTRHAGSYYVTAQTRREAVARVVARLGLMEEQCATVNTWVVTEAEK